MYAIFSHVHICRLVFMWYLRYIIITWIFMRSCKLSLCVGLNCGHSLTLRKLLKELNWTKTVIKKPVMEKGEMVKINLSIRPHVHSEFVFPWHYYSFFCMKLSNNICLDYRFQKYCKRCPAVKFYFGIF